MATEADSLIYCDAIMLYKSSYTADGLLPAGVTVNGGPEFWNVVMGEQVTQEDLWLKAERILNLERAIMVREGRTKEDDTFFDPVFDEINPVTGNPMIPRDKFAAVMEEYYQTRGWDVATGIPTRAKLEALDLADVADELTARGLL
jgi:aldehyde:ferredoxin oxidoreductase